MNVVVTGGTGFIGRRLVPALAARGHAVTVVARRPATIPGAALALAGDVADRGIAAALTGAETIIHLAGLADASSSATDPVGFTTVNALGTLNVLEAARRGGAGVILASSQRVYEPWHGPLREDAPLRPTTVYGYSKLAAENWAMMYARLYDMPTMVLRLFTVYGPGQRAGRGDSGVVAIFGERALAGRELVVHNRHLRDFVYVTDVVRAFELALERLREPTVRGRVYNIGTGRVTALDELAFLVREASGRADQVAIRVCETDAPREESVAVIDRARGELGYAPTVPLPEGVTRYLHWLREQE